MTSLTSAIVEHGKHSEAGSFLVLHAKVKGLNKALPIKTHWLAAKKVEEGQGRVLINHVSPLVVIDLVNDTAYTVTDYYVDLPIVIPHPAFAEEQRNFWNDSLTNTRYSLFPCPDRESEAGRTRFAVLDLNSKEACSEVEITTASDTERHHCWPSGWDRKASQELRRITSLPDANFGARCLILCPKADFSHSSTKRFFVRDETSGDMLFSGLRTPYLYVESDGPSIQVGF